MAAMAALLSTSFLVPAMPAVAIPLPQADADAPTAADMQQYCDDTYVATQTDPTVWKATVRDAASQATTPVMVAGTERSINFRADTGSTFTYAGYLRTEDPLTRTGGSPNMWGQTVFSQKIWDNTLYDVEMQFTHDVTYTWTCDLEEYVTTTRTVGGGNGNGNSSENGQGNCVGDPSDGVREDGNGPGRGAQNSNENSACNGGNDGHVVTTSKWEDRPDETASVTNLGIDDGYDTTATGLTQAGQVAGVNYTELGTYRPTGVRTLACISPGRKGGSWTAKAGYDGGLCSTATFLAAPTVEGREFDPIASNSLPAQ